MPEVAGSTQLAALVAELAARVAGFPSGQMFAVAQRMSLSQAGICKPLLSQELVS